MNPPFFWMKSQKRLLKNRFCLSVEIKWISQKSWRVKNKVSICIILNEPVSFTALMTPESFPGNFYIICRYAPPNAYHTPTLRLPFALALERETYAKGMRKLGEG